MKRGITARWVLAAGLAGIATGAAALQSGRLPGGGTWVTGGVGSDESAVMQAQRLAHNFALLTAAKKSGEFLADAHVAIRDAAGQTVFDADLDGPWLVMDLPPGQYTVEVTAAAQSQHRTADIRTPGQRRELFFYFDTPGTDVLPPGAPRD